MEKVMLNSRVTEVNAIVNRMMGAYKKTSLNTDEHLSAMFSLAETENGKLTQAINQPKAESMLFEKDEERDNKLRSLYFLLLGLAHHPDAVISAAALRLLAVFNKYGIKIIGESYATESSLINSLLTDFAASEMVNDIVAVPGCTQVIAQLTTAQSIFETSRIAYEEQKAKEGITENATAIKNNVLELVNNKIVVYLRAMLLVDESTYGDFVRTIAEMIDENNEVVKKRRKKGVPI